MRVVIELRKGENPEVILNNLYQHTQMQTVFGINLVALRNNQPRLFTLVELLEDFIRHRREVVTRRTIFDLKKARARAHLLEGLAVALANIDPVIALIKKAANPAEARAGLLGQAWESAVVTEMLETSDLEEGALGETEPGCGPGPDGYRLSATQAQAILDLRLHRLTGLEQEKIPQRISGGAGPYPGVSSHPRRPRSTDAGHPRRTGRDPGPVWRCSPYRDHRST